MRVPLEVQAEIGALSKTDDRELNLESIRKIRGWLDEAEGALASGATGSPKDPKIYGHGDANVAGVTSNEYDGVPLAKLRYWENWWSQPERSQWGREEAGRDPQEELRKLRREIEARSCE
jgi:hypothetical protein